jgi:hypothetical protein
MMTFAIDAQSKAALIMMMGQHHHGVFETGVW